MEYIDGGTTCLSKAEFVSVLQRWLEHPDRESVIGLPGGFGGQPLVHVELGGQAFHLNGDTQDKGVQAYLELVREHGPELTWHIVANSKGRMNKVAFGEPPQPLRYFYLYATQEAAAPYTT
ncbi:MAG: hypothetical protein JWP82_924 [Humibacillus sp.]|nr:hypothetical protein [Humibacillus sp.]